MRRRSKAGGKPAKSQRRKTTTLKRRNAPKTVRRRSSPAAALFKRERDEALEHQRATSEVLRVISSSPGELKPVFDAILENAVRICDAKFGNLWLREGNKVRIVAIKGGSQEYRDYLFSEPLLEPDPQSAMGRIVLSKEVVQIDDISNAPTMVSACASRRSR